MPRLPGRESTKFSIKVEDALVASFLNQSEERYWRRVCNIDDCDHRLGPDTTKPGWAGSWQDCSDEASPAIIARDDGTYEACGVACSHCVAAILAEGRS